MIISYTVPEIKRVMDVIVIFHFGLFSALLPQYQLKKIKIKKKKGKYHHLTHAPIIMIRCMVPEIWCDTDGRMDRWTENMTYRGECPT